MTKLFGKKMHFEAYFLQNPCIFEKKATLLLCFSECLLRAKNCPEDSLTTESHGLNKLIGATNTAPDVFNFSAITSSISL